MDVTTLYIFLSVIALAILAYLMYRSALSAGWARYSAAEKKRWKKQQ